MVSADSEQIADNHYYIDEHREEVEAEYEEVLRSGAALLGRAESGAI